MIEEGNRGDRAFDIYSQLLRERIVFLGQEVDDQVANLIISQMLFLEAQNSERDIYLYINSPGGVAYAGMAIYDVMQHVEPDVSTICVGMGMSAAAMILSGGAAGKRFALPNARIMIHQGSAGTRGAPSDMEIQLREVMSLTRRMSEIIAHHSGQPLERVAQDIDRDYYMTSAEARDYGIIDDIILPRRGLCAPDALGVGSERELRTPGSRAREQRAENRREPPPPPFPPYPPGNSGLQEAVAQGDGRRRRRDSRRATGQGETRDGAVEPRQPAHIAEGRTGPRCRRRGGMGGPLVVGRRVHRPRAGLDRRPPCPRSATSGTSSSSCRRTGRSTTTSARCPACTASRTPRS